MCDVHFNVEIKCVTSCCFMSLIYFNVELRIRNVSQALLPFQGRLAVAVVGQVEGELSLGGTTCLTLLVQYGLVCFLRRRLSNTAN